MATIGTAFNIATGALDADQAALDIVANNTANVNTPGYTLETPTWQENDSASLSGISFGMGVQVTGAQSQRNRVLEQAMQQQTQTESGSAARLTALNQMQALFTGATSADTTTSAASGISTDLSSFFDALSSLEASPTDIAQRQGVLAAAGTLASDFNGAASDWKVSGNLSMSRRPAWWDKPIRCFRESPSSTCKLSRPVRIRMLAPWRTSARRI